MVKVPVVELDGFTHIVEEAIKRHKLYGGCFECCDKCNYDTHRCPACGEELNHDSTDGSGKRHWVSDCRPDLVEHEIGDACTWSHLGSGLLGHGTCYAYQDSEGEWTENHVHFVKDGPMT